ncbi:MAG: hypothetical protein ACM3O9_00865 [Methylocystaceae bacterium]
MHFVCIAPRAFGKHHQQKGFANSLTADSGRRLEDLKKTEVFACRGYA